MKTQQKNVYAWLRWKSWSLDKNDEKTLHAFKRPLSLLQMLLKMAADENLRSVWSAEETVTFLKLVHETNRHVSVMFYTISCLTLLTMSSPSAKGSVAPTADLDAPSTRLTVAERKAH